MINLRSRGIKVFLKAYVVSALIIAAILSSPILSFIPILLLASYLFFWRWPISTIINLLTDYFMFFTIAILLAPSVGPFFSLLISLPVLVLITSSLEEAAEALPYRNTKYVRSPTSVCLALPLMAIAALGVSLILNNLSLLVACATAIAYFGVLGTLAVRKLPSKPVEEMQVQQRMVAGSEDQLFINLTTKTEIGGMLFLESPYEWLKVNPDKLSLKEDKLLVVGVSLSPSLSGPSIIKLKGYAIDRWGLIQTRFELEPIRLYVIPRARYAAWLAEKYLAETQPGILPLISDVAALQTIYGLRRGIEYYGSRLYQPGDSLKDIDWKHSAKLGELITKEFAELHGQPAIALINLAVGDAEEADELAYKIIVAAISLAHEDIPTALAASDHEDVKVTTTTLHPQQLLLQSLAIAQRMVTFINPVKYLNPPDVIRLRANINRIQFAKSEASKVLAQLLQLEYKSLSNNARLDPASKALSAALAKGDRESNIVIISHRNHDAEALAFNEFILAREGKTVITI